MLKTLIPLALVATAAPAVANTQDVAGGGIRVGYADLNLNHPAGVAQFDRRIARAADALCGIPTGAYLAEVQAAEKCRAAAIRAATPQRNQAIAAARTRPATVAGGR